MRSMESLFPRGRQELAPGAVHVPGWLTLEQQRELVDACRGWAKRMRHTKLPSGGVMSVQTVCLGWHWLPYRYSRTLDDVRRRARRARSRAGSPSSAGAACSEAYGTAPTVQPRRRADQLLRRGREDGMHQDKDERSDAPVVSLSIGDTCTFRFGNTETRGQPYTDVELRSGDLFVFGGAVALRLPRRAEDVAGHGRRGDRHDDRPPQPHACARRGSASGA